MKVGARSRGNERVENGVGKETKPKGCVAQRKWYELSSWQFPKFHSVFFRPTWPFLDANLPFVLFGPHIGRILDECLTPRC